MKAPSIKQYTIGTLRRHLLDEHRFAIPKLQRNFVWDARRAAKLLDSIYYQMPIGSLFLWDMERKSANLIRQSTGVLPSFNHKSKSIWFVIDGQQRLSVIYQAFKAEVRENDAGREIDFGRLCFVVEPDSREDNPPRIVYRKPAGRQLVPLHDILAPDWRKRMPSKAKQFLDKIDRCRNRFLKYPVPIVTVDSATLDEIGEVFVRVNSQGMRITSADRAIALMGALDVRAMAEELRHRVRERVFALNKIDPILMGFNLIAEEHQLDGNPPRLDVMARRWSKRIENDGNELAQFRKQWDRYKKAFFSAVDYLHDRFPIYDESYLPSANMLATLAVFFFHHPKRPDLQQRAEIRKWFWATGLAKRYSGAGYHRNIGADAKLFKALAEGVRRHFTLADLLDPADIQREEYQSSSARTRTYFCLLAFNQPRYLETGEPIPLGKSVISHANRRHRHHVFPQAQMKKVNFSPKTYNTLCNICFLVSADNLDIGKQVPQKYLSYYARIDKAQFQKAMRSHLIPVQRDSGVWESGLADGFKKFRQQRLQLICDAFEKAAGMKLFRRN